MKEIKFKSPASKAVVDKIAALLMGGWKFVGSEYTDRIHIWKFEKPITPVIDMQEMTKSILGQS